MKDQLLTEEELLIRNTVRDYAENSLNVRAAKYDETGQFPWDNINELAAVSYTHLTLPTILLV